MKKMMALIALAGMVVVGCAHKEKNMGGSSDQSTSSSATDSSNPSKNASSDTNSSFSSTNSNSSKPQQQ
jgi:hypothetical protein